VVEARQIYGGRSCQEAIDQDERITRKAEAIANGEQTRK